jgi:hypothetical protein
MAGEKNPMEEVRQLLIQTLGEENFRAITEGVKQHLQSEAYKKAVAERQELMEREDQIVEEASWFGRTGLPEDLERELPRYLRRELGETIFDDGSLKAADLEYLGSAREGALLIHYWRIDHTSCSESPSYAYVELDDEGNSCTGWGDRDLPRNLIKP